MNIYIEYIMNKTSKNSSKTRRKTIKKFNKKFYKSQIVKTFLELINMVKLYHWKTKSYGQHQATDELHTRLNKHTDEFVEVLLGKDASRIKMVGRKMKLMDCDNTEEFKERIYEFRDFFINMDQYFDNKKDSDLMTIRDELLVDVNQFLYLMTFDK
jgi:hypothetical protein